MTNETNADISSGRSRTAHPSGLTLDAYWTDAKAAYPEIRDTHEVRWFGIDAKTTQGIFGYIGDGVKTATYTVPWLLEQLGQPQAEAGDYIVLIDYDGTPTMVLRIGIAETCAFADIDERVTHTDGLSVRNPDVWKPLHKNSGTENWPASGLRLPMTCLCWWSTSSWFMRGLCRPFS